MIRGVPIALLQRLRSVRFARWVNAAAAIALFVAVSAYLAHQHQPLQGSGGADIVCELCVQHGAPAGTPAAVVLHEPVLRVWALAPCGVVTTCSRFECSPYSSRAPPHA